MRHQLRRSLRAGAALLASAAVLAAAALGAPAAAAAPAPAAVLPPSTCTLVGATRTCDIWAEAGSVTLPGRPAPVPVLGYSADGSPATAPGGPTLIATAGETLSIHLHNGLAEPTGLSVVGQRLAGPAAGVPAGGDATYTVDAAALAPGTYLYEAGPTAAGPRQVALGLFGALVVRPAAAGQAYGPSTAYGDEGLLVFSEIDPAFNASPASFNMNSFAPKYWLINGKAYPTTDPVAVTAGQTALLRLVNAGVDDHSIGLLGLHQRVVATGGNPLAHPYDVVAETIPAGSTLDTLVRIPAGAPDGTRFAIYDAGLAVANGGADFGGILTFLTVGGAPASGDTTGPLTSAVSVTPGSPSGLGDAALAATVSDAATGGSDVTAAEYFVDAVGAAGSGTAMSGAFGSPSVGVSATIPASAVAALASGSHTIYVRGQDSAGNWGAVSSAHLVLDTAGPASTVVLTPAVTATGAVSVRVNGDDSASGGATVAAAQYQILPASAAAPTGAGTDMGAPTTTLGAASSFTASATPPSAEGAYRVYGRSQDSLGSWGAYASAPLTVDRTGPAASAVTVAPNPNNGTLSANGGPGTVGGSLPSIRVDAAIADPTSGGVSSAVVAGEAFVDTVGAVGSGYAMQPTDGTFSTSSEGAYVFIPLSALSNLANGSHAIYVRAKDAAGNWGAAAAGVLVIDRAAPTVSGVTLAPAATNAGAVAVSASASDAATGGSSIAAGELFVDAAGTAGTGAALTVSGSGPTATLSGSLSATTVAALSAGSHTVYVRAKDSAGNWGTTATATLLVDRTPPTFTSITLTPNSVAVGTASVTLSVNGAADTGGSGVAGGEYWFGTTNIAEGTGTAFTGTSGIAVPTASLAAGSYTVRVRIRDAAGNWSTGTNGVRTATLTVTAPVPDAIFANGFETGTRPWGWTSASTNTASRLNVTAAAALAGTQGLQAQGNNTNYVQYTFGTVANPASSTFDARFSFNANGNASAGQDIFAAATAGNFNTNVFRVRYRLNGATPQVQLQIGNTANATWVNLGGAGSHRIEVVWQAVGSGGPNPGTLQLYVDGVLGQTLVTTSTSSVGAVRLGSVTSGGSATLMYFDAFSAKRSVSPLIGP